jgi:hypothetical protein
MGQNALLGFSDRTDEDFRAGPQHTSCGSAAAPPLLPPPTQFALVRIAVYATIHLKRSYKLGK